MKVLTLSPSNMYYGCFFSINSNCKTKEMTKLLKINLFAIIALLTSGTLFAQDKIYRKNPTDTIPCKIVEVGEELIKYSTDTYSQNLTFSVDKNNVSRIVFENGKEMTFADSMFGKENYESQRKDAIKLSFLSPLMGAAIFSYEHSVKPGQSMEFGLGIIGAGKDVDDVNPFGAIAKFGYKFITSPDWYDRRHRYSHILKGSYVKPEVTVLHYTADYYRFSYNESQNDYIVSKEKANTTMLSFMIVGGKQWVFNDVFLVDLFAGVGYGFGHNPRNESWHYGFLGADGSTPLTLTAGLKIGFLLGKKK